MHTISLRMTPAHVGVGVSKDRFTSQDIRFAVDRLCFRDGQFKVTIVGFRVAALIGDHDQYQLVATTACIVTMQADCISDGLAKHLLAGRIIGNTVDSLANAIRVAGWFGSMIQESATKTGDSCKQVLSVCLIA